MRVIDKIQIDLSKRRVTPKVDAVQNDACTRGLEISLCEDGVPWIIPADVSAAVAFRKPDGTKGLYDQLPDGTSAITTEGSVITVIFSPEMLTVPGVVKMSVVFYDTKLNQLSTFCIEVVVEQNPSAGKVISNNYYRYQTLGALNESITEIFLNLENAVLVSEQNLTPDNKKQARSNIGAVAVDNVSVGQDAWSSKNIVDRLCPAFSVSGGVVTCEPVEGYPLEVEAHGKNLLPYPYSSHGLASNLGIAITTNDDGSVTFNGTATGGFYFFLQNNFTEATLPAGIYCISTAGRSATSIQVEGQKDGVHVKSIKSNEGSFAVDYSTYDTVRIFLYCASGTTVNETIYPQLELGSEVTEYAPPNIALTITRCGKNLFDTKGEVKEVWCKNSDGDIVFKNGFEICLPPGTYTVHAEKATTGTADRWIYGVVTDTNYNIIANCNIAIGQKLYNRTITMGDGDKLLLYNGVIGSTLEGAQNVLTKYFDIQIEQGSVATAYESYAGGSFAVGEEIPALPGVNYLYADAGSITVSGRADPRPIINNMQNRLAAIEAALASNT